MARARARKSVRRNPLLPRLQHVANTYGEWVTYQTALAWAEANGQHALAESIEQFYKDEPLPEERDQPAQAMFDAVASLVQPGYITAEGIATSTRFDRYLPWVARELNKVAKRAVKIENKVTGLGHHDFADVKRAGRPAPGSIQDLYAGIHFRGARGSLTDEQKRLFTLATEAKMSATLTGDALRRRLRGIVDWAEAEGIDIGGYDADDAIDRAEDHGHGRKLAGHVAQGRVVYEWPDGWAVQELNTQEQLDDESEVMQHCVEDYKLDDSGGVRSLSGEAVEIFSLRDPKGRPHATMEFSGSPGRSLLGPVNPYVSQLRGKQNDQPRPEYLKRMVEFRHHLPARTLEPAPVRDWPPHADGLREKFLGAFHTTSGQNETGLVLVYEDGTLLSADDLWARVEEIQGEAKELFPNDLPGQRQWAIEYFDRLAPEGLKTGSHLELPEWFQWSLFVKSDGKIRVTGYGDEMVEWLAGTKADPAMCLPFRRELAQQRRGMRAPAQLNRAQLKRKLMQG